MPDPSKQLLEAAAALNDPACRRLVQHVEPLIRAAVQSGFFQSEQDEEEILNDIRLAVFRALPRWDPARGKFSTFVYGIARNHLNGYIRRVKRRLIQEDGAERSREVSFTDLPASRNIAAVAPDQDGEAKVGGSSPYLEAFHAVYEQLTDEERVVVDHLVRGEPRNELARALGIPLGTAKMRASRTRARLKEAIEAHLKLTKA
jgi:RNA polymerase sigma-70 factor, ECF subfamily